MSDQTTDLKSLMQELDKAFGKDFSKNNPELVIKHYKSKAIENAAATISSSVDSLAMKMELSNIRGAGGMGGMGMGLGDMGMGGGLGMMGMGRGMGDMMDGQLDEDFDFGEEGLGDEEGMDEGEK